MPYPVVFQIRIMKPQSQTAWVNIGQVTSGSSLQFPMVTNESSIELRIKVIDDNRTFPDWSSSVVISKSTHSIDDDLVLTDKNGISSLRVFIGVETNRWSRGDLLADQIKMKKNAAARTIFVYLPTILVDYTGQDIEFMSSGSLLKQRDSSCRASQICGSLRQANPFGQEDNAADSDAVLYFIGGKTNALAIRQFSHQTTSSWSRPILIGARKSHHRIEVASFPVVGSDCVFVFPPVL